MLELEMVDKGCNYLTELPMYRNILREVPFLSRCIDVVIISSSNEIITIEFKIKNWRHAIEQAQNHKLGADKSYICLPKRQLTDVLKNALEESGIGLLFYSEEEKPVVEEIIGPAQNSQNIEAFRTILLTTVERLLY